MMSKDQELKQTILAALEWSPHVDHAHIGVAVENGIVTLTGHVESQFARAAALEAVRRRRGVKGLADEIEVRLAGGRAIADDQLAAAIRRQLEHTSSVPEERVGIEVRKGFVKLTGTVEWPYQRLIVEQQVSAVPGVIGLSNAIHVTQRPSCAAVRREIRRALHHEADEEAGQIEAEVEGGIVYLSGALPTQAQKAKVEDAVWLVPGVTEVVDKIEIFR